MLWALCHDVLGSNYSLSRFSGLLNLISSVIPVSNQTTSIVEHEDVQSHQTAGADLQERQKEIMRFRQSAAVSARI
jgi:hypothetical protein